MNMRRILLTLLSLMLLMTAFAAQAEMIPFDVQVGYRWLDLRGNQDMYRSQVNERGGLLLRSFTLSTGGDGSAFDRFRVDASDLGVGPAGSLRIDAGRSEVFNLRLRYRRSNAFSALPMFANPLGSALGQHTYNRNRVMFDGDVEFLPGKMLTPFVGVSLNRYEGPGTSTYHVGQDEFKLDSVLNDADKEYRIGTGFNLGMVYGQVVQGWRRSKSHQSMTLALNSMNGNEPGPILEQNQTAGQIVRDDKSEVKTPFFNGFVTGQTDKLRVTGNYARFAADSSGSESETVAGTFASFPLGRYFTGLTEQAGSEARNHTWRGAGRAEYTIMDGFDVFGSWQREHRELEGVALINTLYRQTITFGGVDPRDIQTVLGASSSIRRDDDVGGVGFSAKSIGPMAFRAEYRVSRQEVGYAPDLAELVIPGSQFGTITRRIKTWDIGTTYSDFGLLLSAAWRRDNADTPVFRTDYLNRERVRTRAAWASPNNFFKVGIVHEQSWLNNDEPGIELDANMRQYSSDFQISPIKQFSVRGSFTKFKTDSKQPVRLPQNFSIETSVYGESGQAKEGGFTLAFVPVQFDGSISRLNNKGSYPMIIDRMHFGVSFDLKAHTGIVAEYDYNKYKDALKALTSYEAKRYGVYLHYRP